MSLWPQQDPAGSRDRLQARLIIGEALKAADLLFGRIHQRLTRLVAVRKAEKEGDEDLQRQLTAKCYGQLRLAWERCIEEVLLNGAVQRFGEGVSTQRLKGVTVTDDDYREIDTGMTKSSKFEHDAAAPVGRLPIPAPDELSGDIESLVRWRETIDKRVKNTAKARD